MSTSQALADVDAVHTLTGPLERARGVIGREPGPDEAYVFEFDSVDKRTVHTVGVRRPLCVEWYVDGARVHRERLPPWTGRARHCCDRVVETGARDG